MGSSSVMSQPSAVFFRILTADLPSLQSVGNIAEQLAFILTHEPELPGLQKRWLLAQIGDASQRQILIQLLEQHDQPWHELPFQPEVYATCWTDLGTLPKDCHPWAQAFTCLNSDEQTLVLDYVGRSKSLYLCNPNAAANHALRLGWADAPWVFVADTASFLTLEAWQVIRPLLRVSELAYLAVPTAVLTDSQLLLQPHEQPPLATDGPPLLGFARGGHEPFNATLRLAAGADDDLPRRLGLSCPWRHEFARPGAWEEADRQPLPDRARMVQAGWAYRLAALPGCEPSQQREAMRLLARQADMRLIGASLQRYALRCWTDLDAAGLSVPGLAAIAANARAIPPLSVTDKPESQPGSDERRYVNAVPHWQTLAGIESAIDRNVLLQSAGPICGDVSQHYDRVRLQMMIDCVCTLALDGHSNGNAASFDHAHRLVRTWFLDPATAMIPDGAYARLAAIDSSRNVLEAAIDFRDFYPFLDAISLLQRNDRLSSAEIQQLEEWFDAFLAWLADDSVSFLREYSTRSACTWYHLLMLAIAAYRGRKNVAAQVFDNLPGLLAAQFRADGSPSSAVAGSRLRHEHLFNLQAWANLVVLSSALGRNLLAFCDSRGRGLLAAFAYARNQLPDDSASSDWLAAMQAISHPQAGDMFRKPTSIPVLPDASSGLPPFWTLCQPAAVVASSCNLST